MLRGYCSSRVLTKTPRDIAVENDCENDQPVHEARTDVIRPSNQANLLHDHPTNTENCNASTSSPNWAPMSRPEARISKAGVCRADIHQTNIVTTSHLFQFATNGLDATSDLSGGGGVVWRRRAIADFLHLECGSLLHESDKLVLFVEGSSGQAEDAVNILRQQQVK